MRRDDHRSEIARSIARPSQGESRPETGRPFSLSTHVPSAELNAPASYLMVYFTSGRRLTCKQVPLDGRVDTLIAVVYLSDAKVHADGDQGNRLVLGEPPGVHQESAHLPERILERKIDGGFLVGVLLRGWAEFLKVVGGAKSVQTYSS